MGHSDHEKAMANLFFSATYLHDLIEQWEAFNKALEECARRWNRAKTQNFDGKEISLGFSKLHAIIESALPGLRTAEKTLREHHRAELVPPKAQLAAIHVLITTVMAESNKVPGPGRVWRWDSDYEAVKHAMEPINGLQDQGDTIKTLYSYLGPLAEHAS